MQVETIQIDKTKAKEMFRAYKAHAHWSEPIDHEVRRVYQLIAQGRMVIKALESVKAAGLNDQKLPKLAIVRADAAICHFRGFRDGSAVFHDPSARVSFWSSHEGESRSRVIRYAAGSFPGVEANRYQNEAIVPLIPIDKRPKRGLANYHILWEAEWTRRVPVDPMLLRRIGRGDMWLVVAAWDLTEVERAALSARL